jgi:hypothetical protein
MLHDGMTEFGQRRAAAVLASLLRSDDRGAKAPVQAVNQQPGAPVRHSHLPAKMEPYSSIISSSLILPGPMARSASKSMRSVSLGTVLRPALADDSFRPRGGRWSKIRPRQNRRASFGTSASVRLRLALRLIAISASDCHLNFL